MSDKQEVQAGSVLVKIYILTVALVVQCLQGDDAWIPCEMSICMTLETNLCHYSMLGGI